MERKNPPLVIKLLAACAFLVMLAVNALSVFLPLNGVTTGEVSDAYPNLFTPAPVTFGIWGLIYLLLALHTLYLLGLFRGQSRYGNSLGLIGLLFALSSLLNAAWIFAWHYEKLPLSMLIMAALLICLIVINLVIQGKDLSPREKFFLRLPFNVYLGWITVATIANAATLLVSIGWEGGALSQETWTVLILIVGALIGAVTTLRLGSAAYGLVLIWAYVGILIKHLSPSGFDGAYPGIIAVVCICLVFLIAAVIYTVINKRKRKAYAR